MFLAITKFNILKLDVVLKILTITSGGYNYTCCAIIFVLFVLLYDALLMVAETIETCRSMVIYDKRFYLCAVCVLSQKNKKRSSVYWDVTQS